jgi:hypothetical protein
MLPGFGPQDHGLSGQNAWALNVDGDHIAAFGRKVRAVVFKFCGGQLIAPDTDIETVEPHSEPNHSLVFAELMESGKRVDSGPLAVGFAAAKELGLFAISLWGRLDIFAKYELPEHGASSPPSQTSQ